MMKKNIYLYIHVHYIIIIELNTSKQPVSYLCFVVTPISYALAQERRKIPISPLLIVTDINMILFISNSVAKNLSTCPFFFTDIKV